MKGMLCIGHQEIGKGTRIATTYPARRGTTGSNAGNRLRKDGEIVFWAATAPHQYLVLSYMSPRFFPDSSCYWHQHHEGVIRCGYLPPVHTLRLCFGICSANSPLQTSQKQKANFHGKKIRPVHKRKNGTRARHRWNRSGIQAEQRQSKVMEWNWSTS